MGLRLPERISSQVVYPFVLRNYNALSQDFANLENRKSKKTALATRGIIFLSKRMHAESLKRFDDTLSNVNIYNPVKNFYPLSVIEVTPWFDYRDDATNFSVKKGDPYLSIHLGSKKPEIKFTQAILEIARWILRRKKKPGLTLKKVTDSMKETANYISANREKLPIRPIAGITYDQLTKASTRYGFTVTQAQLPEELKVNFMNAIKKIRRGKEIKDVRLCFQSYDDLIRRFRV